MQSEGALRSQLKPVQVLSRTLFCSHETGLSVTPEGAQYQWAFASYSVFRVRKEFISSQVLMNRCHQLLFSPGSIGAGQNLTPYHRCLLLDRQNPDMMTEKNINAVTEDLKLPKQPTKNKNNIYVNKDSSPNKLSTLGKQKKFQKFVKDFVYGKYLTPCSLGLWQSLKTKISEH